MIRFLHDLSFKKLIFNTLGISVYKLLAGFPIPIVLALLLNSSLRNKYKKVVQFAKRVKGNDPYELQQWLFDAAEIYMPYVPKEVMPPLMYSEKDGAVVSEKEARIFDIVNQSFARFTLGDRNLKEWDAYLKELKDSGLEEVLKIYQSAEHSLEITQYVKSIQPKCLVSGRIGNWLQENILIR